MILKLHKNARTIPAVRAEILQIAPSGYRRYVAQQRHPELRSQRVQHDETLITEIERIWQANLQVYGADKVWRQLNREGITVARCMVERLADTLY